jgi:hypothetical protein
MEYGDGIIQYAYKPPKGKGEDKRLCGVLGKDRLVSSSPCHETEHVGSCGNGQEGDFVIIRN